MKKIMSLLLCAALLLCGLVGCGEPAATPTPYIPTAKEVFVDNISAANEQKEGAFTADIAVLISTAMLGDESMTAIFGENIDAKLSVSGSLSETAKQVSASIGAALKMNGAEVKLDLTDVLMKDGTAYINYKKVFDLMLMLQGAGGAAAYPYASEYMKLSPDEMGGDVTDENAFAKTAALAEHLKTVCFDALKDEYFAKTETGAVMTISKAAVAELVTAVAADMGANPAAYSDAYAEIVKISGETGEELPTAEEMAEELKKVSAEAEEFLKSEDWTELPDFSLIVKAEKTDAEYVLSVELSSPDAFSVSVGYTFKTGKVEAVPAPEGALTMDELSAIE